MNLSMYICIQIIDVSRPSLSLFFFLLLSMGIALWSYKLFCVISAFLFGFFCFVLSFGIYRDEVQLSHVHCLYITNKLEKSVFSDCFV